MRRDLKFALSSLKNIFKELQDDMGILPSTSGNLKKWAEQGVLLLNTVLTVRAHQANSHADKGWEKFTDAILREINKKEERIDYFTGLPHLLQNLY